VAPSRTRSAGSQETASAPGPPDAPERREGFLTSRILRAGQLATALAAIIGLLLLVIDRVPWADEEPAPRRLGVVLSDLRVDHPVKLGAFLRTKDRLAPFKERMSASGLPAAAIRKLLLAPGVEVDYLMRIEGPPGRRLELHPNLYEHTGRTRARTPEIEQTEVYESEAWVDPAPDRTWLPYPIESGRYYVELDVYEPEEAARSLVASERTPTFAVAFP
jgi:hypothetical protein